MTISNVEIATIFEQLAHLLEIQGENPFKIRAYENAAREIRNMASSLSQMVKDKIDISKLPTIGEHIALKIIEIVHTGKLSKLEKLKKSFPSHILDILKIEGIGPKRAKILYESLHVGSLDDLRKAALNHRIRELNGFNEKIEKNIIDKTILAKKIKKRFMYSVVEPHAKALVAYLEKSKDIIKVLVAGSFRRRKDTVGDIDMVGTSKNPSKVIDYFMKYPDIKNIILHGDTRSTFILKNNIQVDFRCVQEDSYGSALHYFTGSRSHVLAIRNIAVDRNLKINEYGIYKDEQKIAGLSEVKMYKTMGFSYIEPELRENRGELEASSKGKLPHLINQEDIKGDLHMHTVYSDGQNSIREMVKTAQKKGYKYIAITDHSKHIGIVNGMDEAKLAKQIDEIDEINESIKGIVILKSIEVDILEDGTLAMSNDMLKKLDLVVAGVHDKFDLSKKKQTQRILRAIENPYVSILAHPTGRLINQREPYDLDMDMLFKKVKQRGCFLEINAQPQRLDLNDIYVKFAKDIGIKFAISTDSHNSASLVYMKYGIYQARRGWVEKKDVINTLSLSKLKQILNKPSPSL